MARALLIVPHFWDPVCVPLGVASLRAYAQTRGHGVNLYDFNTDPDVFSAQRAYFVECKRQFPQWHQWNIERNGTEMLAMHQVLFLERSGWRDYADLVVEVLNVDGRDPAEITRCLDVSSFDRIFEALYARVSKRIEILLATYRPEVVGCSLYNSTWPGTLFILKRIKELDPRIRTVVGGPGPMMGIASRAEEIDRFFHAHEFIDYYVLGEGEQAFAAILDRPDVPRGVLGAELSGAGDYSVRPRMPMEFGLPDYGELEVMRYLQLSIATSRGCPFECSFCAETVFWGGFRAGSSPRVWGDITTLASRYKRDSFYLCDSLANHIISSLTTENERGGTGYKFDCYLRPDAICTDSARVGRWRAGGLVRARLGLESGSQRMLDAMVKKTTVENMESSLRSLASQGIATSTLWIIGYPGETEEDFDETLRFIRANRQFIYQADAWLFQYHPVGLPGSAKLEAERGSHPRFSTELTKVIAMNPVAVAEELSSRERFERLGTFVREVAILGIPNPYNVYQWVEADARWKVLVGHGLAQGSQDSILALNS